MTVIKNKKNMVDYMQEFFVAVGVDDQGKEGVLATVNTENVVPVINSMIGATEEDLRSIKKQCQKISNELNLSVKIIRFTSKTIHKNIM